MADQVTFENVRVGATSPLVLTPVYTAGDQRGQPRTPTSSQVLAVNPEEEVTGGVSSWSASPYGFEYDASPLGTLSPDMAPCYLYDSSGNRYRTELTGKVLGSDIYTCEPLPPEVDTADLVRWRIPCRPLGLGLPSSPYTTYLLGTDVTGCVGSRVLLWRFGFVNGDTFEAVGRFRVLGRTTTPKADAVLKPKSPGEVQTEVLEVTYAAGDSKRLPVDISVASYWVGHAGRYLRGTWKDVATNEATTVEVIAANIPSLVDLPLILIDATGVETETYVTTEVVTGDNTRTLGWPAVTGTAWFGAPVAWRLPVLPTKALAAATVDSGQVTMEFPASTVGTPGPHVCGVRLTVDSAYHWLSCPFDVEEGRTI